MKKNKMMRLASWLLVLTLLTTCIISGTFAKYVTSDEAEDTARVAKWGVTTTISGALFGEHYFSNDDTSQNQISTTYTGSVDSIKQGTPTKGDGGNIVAPGTKSENMIINISGIPEVEGEVAVKVTDPEKDSEAGIKKANYSDIWLKEAAYGVMSDVTITVGTKYDVVGLYTKNADDTTYTLANAEEYDPKDKDTKYYKLIDVVDASDETSFEGGDAGPRCKDGKYYPILWGYTSFQGNSNLGDVEASEPEYNNIADLKEVIEKGKIINEETEERQSPELNGKTFQSLDILSNEVGGMIINWAWPFNDEGVAVVDGCDTILGKLMAWNSDSNYQVVKIESTTTGDTTTTTYTDVTTETTADDVTYAKVGEGENAEKVACLTVGFNIKVTVSQVN